MHFTFKTPKLKCHSTLIYDWIPGKLPFIFEVAKESIKLQNLVGVHVNGIYSLILSKYGIFLKNAVYKRVESR